jgi:putative ABC transport system permease protein
MASAFGALFAALNTMYSAISTRAKEIATLRAIGFGGVPVMISVLAESMLPPNHPQVVVSYLIDMQ